MLGAAIGDIVGSIYEGEPIKTKDFPLFGANACFTDDTVCTVAVADALLAGRDPAASLRDWGQRYQNAGYGGYFRQWLQDDQAGPYGSWGNGAAMRVGPVGWLAVSLEQVIRLADEVTAVTHDHPEGLRGARAVAVAVWLARAGLPAEDLRQVVSQYFGYDLSAGLDQIRPDYSFDVSCQGTVPPAILCVVEATDFEDALRNAISLGGDADTLACIAGAIAEPLFGIAEPLVQAGRAYLPREMLAVFDAVYAVAKPPDRG